MKKTLLAAGVALAVLGGAATTTASAATSVGIYVGSPGYHHHYYRHRGHYWWHNRWYDYQPTGYYYVAPPYPYEHVYWRTHWRESHHRRDWDRRHRY